MKNITLIGMPGSGKSTLGVLLAKTLGFGFVDTDLVIQQREGDLLQNILDKVGTEAFLDLEADAICSVDCDKTVIAPGGSVICRERGIEHLRALGPVVYLRIPCDVLERRIHNMGSRGIAFRPGETLKDIYDYRTPLYEKYADIVVDGDKGSLEETLAAVLQALIGM
ncbi:shikimate kinase [Flavonifractor sp. An92]|uniref:shikimate kinase n=1 Tax=Flavonifractor sp. An92 TaxID=1965666 RepID=UPI000B3ABE16|nr:MULTISPECIES: shikimate kinase [unclassified Flavonifractor]OUN06151.1 shikimate kinase [Flavonifractor sp. An92]OUQ22609.1 shikimate kinase [Flavonifractor sp. An135]